MGWIESFLSFSLPPDPLQGKQTQGLGHFPYVSRKIGANKNYYYLCNSHLITPCVTPKGPCILFKQRISHIDIHILHPICSKYFQLFHGIRALALGKRSVGLCEVWSEYLVTCFLFGAVHRCVCILLLST